jgi:SH3-like domain-containing protein
MGRGFFAFIFAVVFLLPGLAPAGSAVPPSGQPVPRFVTVRSDEVNVRSGPGERYPVQWVLKKKGMPVEVIAEYENWRKIRDWMGTEGWVNQALLSGRRTVVIYPGEGVMRIAPDAIARPVARLENGVVGRIGSCREEWCEISVGQMEGWVSKETLWGVYPREVLE